MPPSNRRSRVSFLEELNAVKSEKDPYKRAKRFEVFLVRLLEAESLKVEHNPKTAKPRQTDLVAVSDDDFFLIEAKWTKRKTGIDDIVQVRDRLKRVPASMFACVFSIGGFSKLAIKEVEQDRSREIYLFNETELRAMVSGRISFQELLAEKKKCFRVHGCVSLLEEELTHDASMYRLRDSPDVFQVGKKLLPWLRNRTGFNEIIFSTEFLDFSGRYSGSAFSLQLQPDIDNLHDLRRTLNAIKNLLGLSGQGPFAIHQSGEGWHGFGLESFLSAAAQQETRYNELNWERYHHSEELGYLDHIEGGGLICITTRQSTGTNDLHSTFLEIYLPGTPVDSSNIRRLCKITKQEGQYLELVRRDLVYSSGRRLGIKVRPVGTVVSTIQGHLSVSGLIVENPFLHTPLPTVDDDQFEATLNLLRESQCLICSLRDWHNPGKLMKTYRLLSIEACWIEHFCAFHLVCNWD
jgi:hypothetical protein